MPDEQKPHVRASDADRELTASQLRRHATAGRLTMDELDERLASAYAAKTLGELSQLLRDLPELPAEPVPSPPSAAQRWAERRARLPERRGDRHATIAVAMWGSYLSVNLTLIVIWLLTGIGYPWWLWVAAPWGAALVSQEIRQRTQPPPRG